DRLRGVSDIPPREPFGPCKPHAGLSEADAAKHSAHRATGLAQGTESVQRFAVHPSKIAHIPRNVHIRQTTLQPIEPGGGGALEPRSAFPSPAPGKTSSQPSRQRATISKTTSGGSCKSASITMTASPRAIHTRRDRDLMPERGLVSRPM